MFKSILPVVLGLTILGLTTSVLAPTRLAAAEAGNEAEGRRITQVMCAECHAVGRSESRSPMADATPFEAVANATRTTELSLNAWLTGPHINMPGYIFDEWERQNILTYILSLKTSSQQ